MCELLLAFSIYHPRRADSLLLNTTLTLLIRFHLSPSPALVALSVTTMLQILLVLILVLVPFRFSCFVIDYIVSFCTLYHHVLNLITR